MRRVLLPAIAVLLCLSGCAAERNSAPSTPSPSRSVTSDVFGSQAQSVWDGYFKSYVELLSNQDARVSDIRPYVSGAEYKYFSTRLMKIRAEKIRLEGSVQTRGFRVLDARAQTALACIDNGSSKLVDEAGAEVSDSGRPRTSTIKLTFAVENSKLVLDKDETWTGSSVC